MRFAHDVGEADLFVIFAVFVEADCRGILKYRPGVVPRVFRNIEMKALGVL